eukprot:1144110-Pelagomonas_calceolata.AAC.2
MKDEQAAAKHVVCMPAGWQPATTAILHTGWVILGFESCRTLNILSPTSLLQYWYVLVAAGSDMFGGAHMFCDAGYDMFGGAHMFCDAGYDMFGGAEEASGLEGVALEQQGSQRCAQRCSIAGRRSFEAGKVALQGVHGDAPEQSGGSYRNAWRLVHPEISLQLPSGSLAASELQIEASNSSYHQDQAWRTTRNRVEPHSPFFLFSLGNGVSNAWYLSPRCPLSLILTISEAHNAGQTSIVDAHAGTAFKTFCILSAARQVYL